MNQQENPKAKEYWDFLETAIAKIYQRQHVNLSYMELYNKAYNLVLYNFGDYGYRKLKGYMRDRYLEEAKKIHSEKDVTAFLASFQKSWVEAGDFLESLSNIFTYLQEKFIPKYQLSTVKGLGYQVFKESFVENTDFFEQLQRNILDTIKNDRHGNMIDKTLLRNVIATLKDLGRHVVYKRGTIRAGFEPPQITGSRKTNQATDDEAKSISSLEVYEKYFQEKFLQESEKFFIEEAQKTAAPGSPLEYLKIAEKKFNEEMERANFYIDVSTKRPLIDAFIFAYIISQSQDIVEMVDSGLRMLFNEGDFQNTKKIMSLFHQNKLAQEKFDDVFYDYEKKGLEVTLKNEVREGAEKEQFGMIKGLIQYRKRCLKALKLFHDIEGDASRVKVVKVDDIYEREINANKKLVMELNSYLDFNFREGFRSLQDQEIEGKLDEVMDIFKYIRDRDVFEKGYSFFLSKRLLQIKNLNQDNEKAFMGKLRQECGNHYTSKVETMLTDINLSKDFYDEFKQHVKSLQENSDQIVKESLSFAELFDVKVLTQVNWPNVVPKLYQLPEEVKSWTTYFDGYYSNKYPGRKLIWILSLGNSELRSTLGGKKKEFLVSSIQMMVLLLFNGTNTVKIDEIIARTKVPFEDIEMHLAGLLAVQVLKKDGEGKDVKESDTLIVNEKFVHKEYRVRVPATKKKREDMSGEVDSLIHRAEGERKLKIEACIVRIMKSRRTLKNTDLISEVMKMSNIYQFKPETKLIKVAIEGLIDKEYLARDQSDRNVYNYIS